MIPKDPIMLLSFVNTQLRDNYSSLEEFCRAFNTDINNITKSLNTVNYFYDRSLNQFK